MKRLLLATVFFPFFISACSWDPGGLKAQREWLNQKKIEENLAEQSYKQRSIERERDKAKRERDFIENNPEHPITIMTQEPKNQSEKELNDALNGMGFLTRHPGTKDSSLIYMRLGSYHLTLSRVASAAANFGSECKRISAYSSIELKDRCVSIFAKSLSDFSSMAKDPGIPGETKLTAVNEASHGDYIDFEHATRFARMHARLCREQDGRGYVALVTVAAPCSGSGDVLNITAARRAGLIL